MRDHLIHFCMLIVEHYLKIAVNHQKGNNMQEDRVFKQIFGLRRKFMVILWRLPVKSQEKKFINPIIYDGTDESYWIHERQPAWESHDDINLRKNDGVPFVDFKLDLKVKIFVVFLKNLKGAFFVAPKASVQASQARFEKGQDHVNQMRCNDVHDHGDYDCWAHESVPLNVKDPVFALERLVTIKINLRVVLGQLLVDYYQSKPNVDVLGYEHFVKVCHHLVWDKVGSLEWGQNSEELRLDKANDWDC